MRVAVLAAPLNVADPHRDTGQFGRKLIDFQPENIVRPRFHRQRHRQTQLLTFDMHALFQITQRTQGQIQKIATAAGRIKHPKMIQAQQKTLIQRRRFVPWLLQLLRRHNLRLDALPRQQQRLADQGINQLGNRTGVGVMRPQRRPGCRIKTPLEQGTENGRINRPPIHLRRRTMQSRQISRRQRRHIDMLEQTAVEPGNVMVAVLTVPVAHGRKQLFDAPRRLGRIATSIRQQGGKNAGG